MFRTIRLLLVVSLLCGFALIPVTGHAKSDGTLESLQDKVKDQKCPTQVGC